MRIENMAKMVVNAHRLPKYLHRIGKQVAESNDGFRILTGSSKIAVSAHAQSKFGQKSSPERLARRRDVGWWPQVAMHSSCDLF